MLFLLLLFIITPVIELWLLIEIGTVLGGAETVLLCLLTAAAGFSLIRYQGFGLAQTIRRKTASGEPIGINMIEGLILAFSGLCLFVPGIMTDLAGATLLIPPIRRKMIHILIKKARIATIDNYKSPFTSPNSHQRPYNKFSSDQRHKDASGPVIEGEAQTITNDKTLKEKDDQNI